MIRQCALLIMIVTAGILASCNQINQPTLTQSPPEQLAGLAPVLLSPQEVSKLDSMKQTASEKLIEVLGTERAMRTLVGEGPSMTTIEASILESKLTELLVSEFGERGLDFIQKGAMSPLDLGSTDSNSKSVLRWDPSLSSGACAIIWVSYYELHYQVKYLKFPWAAWCWAETFIVNAAGDVTSGCVMSGTTYHDELTPTTESIKVASDPTNASTYVSSFTSVTGNTKWGWFPTVANVWTKHALVDSVITYGAKGDRINWYGTFSTNGWNSGTLYWTMP